MTAAVLDARDPHALGEFYRDLLGWPIGSDEPDWVTVRPPDGGMGLSIQLEEDHVAPTWPAGPGDQQMQLHLDIEVDDLGAASAAGARARGHPGRVPTPEGRAGAPRSRRSPVLPLGRHLMTALDTVRRIALDLPGAYEQPTYEDRPSWRTKPRMFAWFRPDPEALVVWVDTIEDKEAMIEAEPEKFFTTPHYDGHPIVLVQIDAVDDAEVRELLTDSWRLRAPKTAVKKWDAEHG